MKKLFLFLLSRQFLILFFCGLALSASCQKITEYSDLNLLTLIQRDMDFSRTKIIFAYPDNPATIWDEHNRLYQIFSGSPESIEIRNGTRVVTFTEPVILKSNATSVEVGLDYVKLFGYLGTYTDARRFLIDERGQVHTISPEQSVPEF